MSKIGSYLLELQDAIEQEELSLEEISEKFQANYKICENFFIQTRHSLPEYCINSN